MEPSPVLYLGNLDSRVDRRHLYELGVQAGPVKDVRTTGKGFGFIEYTEIEHCTYALALFKDSVSLYGRPVRFDYGSRGRG
ncbi:hypothetical protein ACKKBG_A25980 [Auxenochlorella protothecoides x Auxenochlorella symbiontica]